MKFMFFLPLLLCLTGAARLTIVLPSSPSEQEQEASKELAAFLELSTGEKITVQREGDGSSGQCIYLGATEFAGTRIPDLLPRDPEGWLIKSLGDALVISGKTGRGTLYAAMEFLERELGIVFCTEFHTYVPPRPGYLWSKELYYQGQPAFSIRGIYSYFANDPVPRLRFMLRNRLNLFCDESMHPLMRNWGVTPQFGSPKICHTFYFYTKDLSRDEEDCLSLNAAGQRVRPTSPSGPGQICYTYPRTKEIFLGKLHEYIASDRRDCPPDEAPNIYVLEQNDNPDYCRCENCLNLLERYGSYSGVMLDFLNAIAREIAKTHPEIKLLANAYMFTSAPPKGIVPENNVIIRLAQLGREWGLQGVRDTMRPITHQLNLKAKQKLDEWQNLSQIAIWDYWILYDGKSNLPSLGTRAIAENLKYYSSKNVVFVFAECESAHIASFHALRLWLGARFMNNPLLDFRTEVQRFMQAYYGSAAQIMLTYHDFLQDSQEKVPEPIGKLTLAKRTDLSPEFFAAANRLLDDAEKIAGDDEALLARVLQERPCLDYAALRRQKFLPQNEIEDSKHLKERLQRNFVIALQSPLINKAARLKQQNWLDLFLTGLTVQAPVPPEFQEKKIVLDLLWPNIVRKSGRVQVCDDVQAAAGKAVIIKDPLKEENSISLGAYDEFTGKKHLANAKFEIPADNQYHFYPLGPFELTPECFLWTHWSWNIQSGSLAQLYDRSGCNNRVRAYISIKATKTGNKLHYFVDRMILVREE